MFSNYLNLCSQTNLSHGLLSLQKLYFSKQQNNLENQSLIVQHDDILCQAEWEKIEQIYVLKQQNHSVFKKLHKSKYSPFDENELFLLDLSVTLLSQVSNVPPSNFTMIEWESISEIMYNRHWKNCKCRWLKMQAQPLAQKGWSKEEDTTLLELVQIHYSKDKYISWNALSIELSQRTNSTFIRRGKQCRERWMNYLNPSIDRGLWTKTEELLLLKYIFRFGKQWTLISKQYFDGKRTENCIKNRYHSIIKRKENRFLAVELMKQDLKSNSKEFERKFIEIIIKQMEEDPETDTCSIQKLKWFIKDLTKQNFKEIDEPQFVVIKKNKIESFSNLE